jgi:membrane protein required for colicin V production
MHTLDIFFGIAAAFFVFVGVRRGLIGEIVRLVALVAGCVVAFLYHPELARIIKLSSPYLSNGLSFILIYLATALAILGGGALLRKVVRLTPLGWIDYAFGGLIGLVKVLIIFWAVCLSFSTFPLAVKRMNLNRSIVYAAYTKLPALMKANEIIKIRESLKKNVDKEVPKSLKNAQQNIDTFRNKVDSAKKAASRKR